MASPEKRCLYEVLGLSTDCSADEIRSAYKRLALQRHPDKLVQSGLSPADATASFQELVNAYEVLSDPRERAWYDSHRSQILFSDPTSATSGKSSPIPDLFSFFSNSVYSGFSDSGKGFYKVYSDVFDRVYANEVNFAKKLGLGLGAVKETPVMGNLSSPYSQVKAFYDYWLGFVTVMDFCWVDQYDAMAGVNRKSRRVMEDENKKLRKKARREFNETVRGLAEFVKKRDKRVIDMMVKKEAEMERKREEERERKREKERERAERARAFEEPEWARVDEEEIDNGFEEMGGDDNGGNRKSEGQELYCVVCGKKFKSDMQWKNHEQSRKHKEKVLELRESLVDDEEIGEEEEEADRLGGKLNVNGKEYDRSNHREDEFDELNDQFEDDFKIEGEEKSEAEVSSSGEEAVGITRNVNGASESFGSDAENGILEAMVSGHKSRRHTASNHDANPSPAKANGDDVNSDNVGFMEYDNRKSRRRKKEGKREKGKGKEDPDAEPVKADGTDISRPTEENGGRESSNEENPPSHSSVSRSHKVSNQPAERTSTVKRETNTKSKNSSKGRKQKVCKANA